MCGIVAIHSNSGPVDTEKLARATRALHHRGPDGQRQWIAPHGRVGLGHARLSIIDLVTGDQPLANEDGSIHVVVNGEFYDHERIQKELEARGHQLRSRSDSEILVHLYEDLGVHCLHELRGEFAFVLWDERNQQLFAARDRFGIKPLFYAQTGDTLTFASEAKALFAAGVPARWDPDSAFQEFHFVHDAGRSLFEGVQQVLPGHFLLATRSGIRSQRYWDLDFPLRDTPQPERSDEDYVQEVREALLEATRLRLRADVPVGVYLSGGLDSCAILGAAASLRSDRIEAFTVAFEEGEYDEGPIAAEAAHRFGANLHAYRMTEDILADHYADAIYQSETFSGNTNHTAKYLLSRKVREHGFKVVLTGEGSDEIFGGYPFFRRDMMLYGTGTEDAATRQRRVDDMVRANPVWAGLMTPSPHALPLHSVARTFGHVPSYFENHASRAARLRTILRPAYLASFEGRDPYQHALDRLDVPGQLMGREPLDQALYLWTRSFFPNKLLNFLGDRSEMAHSVEGRTPFLDHHLVELVTRMPAHVKIRGMTEKWVLREAARPFLTETVYKRQKHPFFGPPQLKGRILALMRDTFAGRILDDQPFFDAQAVRATLEGLDAVEGRAQRDQAYMMLAAPMCACILQERYGL
jgi:asparagine synthase (glutamine-hydrolysing)